MAPWKGKTKEPLLSEPGVIHATQPTLLLPGATLALGVKASVGTLVVMEPLPNIKCFEGPANQEAEGDDGAEEQGLTALNQMHEELQ